MDIRTIQEVNAIVQDLNNLIRDIEVISVEINQGSTGLGEKNCSSSVASLESDYKYIRNQISEIK